MHFILKTTITKSEVNELPLNKFEGEIVIVESAKQIVDAVDEINLENIIGIDTETRPTFTKGIFNKTALIQIATEKKVYLFRVNKIGMPRELTDILENTKIKKIGIAILQDMKELSDQYHSFHHNNVIDLNVLCKKLNFTNIGARNLSAMILGFRISKRQQTSNWEAASLSESQLRYAATDAWICRKIFLILYNNKDFKI